MKQIQVLTVIILAITILGSCKKEDVTVDGQNGSSGIIGEGPVVTEILPIGSLSGVELATVPNVTIKQGATQEVKAIGYANIIEQLNTNVDNNGVWRIDFMQAVSNVNLTIEITVPNINKLVTSSSGNIVVEGFINQSSLYLESSSAGNITLNEFEGITELAPIVGSAGNINANEDITTLQTLTVNVASAGDFNGFPLTSEDCIVITSSSGRARVTANSTLNATISSNGNVYYKGNPTITENITGSGQVIDAN